MLLLNELIVKEAGGITAFGTQRAWNNFDGSRTAHIPMYDYKNLSDRFIFVFDEKERSDGA